MKKSLRRNAVQKAKAPAPAKAPTQAQVTGKQLADQIVAQSKITAQAILAQAVAATAAQEPKQSTLDAKMMALLTGSPKPSSVDNRIAELAAKAVTRDNR